MKRSPLAIFALVGLLLLLAVRLTMTETIRDTLTQRVALYLPKAGPEPTLVPQLGPTTTIALTVLTLALAGLAVLGAGRCRRHWIALAAILAALALAAWSTFHAGNRFLALTGFCDLAMALLAGWAMAVLCAHESRRRWVICLLIGVLAVWNAKGLYQRFIEIPETIQMYEKDKEAIWRANGWEPGNPAIRLFEGRIYSREVTGFLTLSNVLAAGYLPLILMCAALAVLAARESLRPKVEPTPLSSRKSRPQPTVPRGTEIPLLPAMAVVLAILAAVSVVVLILTQSKGATAACAVALLLLVTGLLVPTFVARHRRSLLAATAILAILGTLAVIGYGLTTHGLPTRSLLFRWHYWTAAVQIIRDHPLLGVGLHNFGDYYTQYKLPCSPEDVKDPHSIFIRYAAEMGLPAMAVLLALIVWLFYRAWGRWLTQPTPTRVGTEHAMSPARKGAGLDARLPGNVPQPSLAALAIGGVTIWFLWWIIRLSLDVPRMSRSAQSAEAEGMLAYLGMLYLLGAAIGFGGWMLAAATLHALPAKALRAVGLAAILGVAAMLLYDQINMALVTGPVAMLFWMLLGAFTAPDEAPEEAVDSPPSPGRKPAGQVAPSTTTPRAYLPWVHHLLAATLLVAGTLLALFIWHPIVTGRFAWDPAVYEKQAALASANDPAAAIAALNDALARDPRSIELRRWRLQEMQRLHQSLAHEIEAILDINRTDPRLWAEMGLMDSDLPASRRREIYGRSLWLDDQLEPQEPKRLPPFQRRLIQDRLQWPGSQGSW